MIFMCNDRAFWVVLEGYGVAGTYYYGIVWCWATVVGCSCCLGNLVVCVLVAATVAPVDTARWASQFVSGALTSSMY